MVQKTRVSQKRSGFTSLVSFIYFAACTSERAASSFENTFYPVSLFVLLSVNQLSLDCPLRSSSGLITQQHPRFFMNSSPQSHQVFWFCLCVLGGHEHHSYSFIRHFPQHSSQSGRQLDTSKPVPNITYESFHWPWAPSKCLIRRQTPMVPLHNSTVSAWIEFTASLEGKLKTNVKINSKTELWAYFQLVLCRLAAAALKSECTLQFACRSLLTGSSIHCCCRVVGQARGVWKVGDKFYPWYSVVPDCAAVKSWKRSLCYERKICGTIHLCIYMLISYSRVKLKASHFLLCGFPAPYTEKEEWSDIVEELTYSLRTNVRTHTRPRTKWLEWSGQISRY